MKHLTASKLLLMSLSFKDQCEAAAIKRQLSLSAWIRRAMQKALDQHHEGRHGHGDES